MCSLLLTVSLKAQREIQFSYDDAGNMTSRIIYMPASVPENMEQPNISDYPNQTNEINSEVNSDNSNNTDNTEQSDNDGVNKQENYFDQLGANQVKIYPNPTKGKLVIDLPAYQGNSNDRIDIVDMQGKLMQRIAPISSSNTIYINDYPPATYIMLIHIGEENTQWKIVKQ